MDDLEDDGLVEPSHKLSAGRTGIEGHRQLRRLFHSVNEIILSPVCTLVNSRACCDVAEGAAGALVASPAELRHFSRTGARHGTPGAHPGACSLVSFGVVLCVIRRVRHPTRIV